MLASRLRRVAAAVRPLRWRRSFAAGLLAAALCGGVAAADPNWTYVINFNHASVINEGSQTSGAYQIWGLGFATLIVGSKDRNIIVADGSCPAGSTVTAYCSVAPIKGSRNAVIYANGAGHNTVFAGYGPSVVFGGTGPNVITSAPTSSLIIGGNAGDTIYANQGATVIYAGTGTNAIWARSPEGDTVFCSGTHDTVYAYPNDQIHNCANVIYATEPPAAVTYSEHHHRYTPPSLRHDRLARRLYGKLKAAERHAKR